MEMPILPQRIICLTEESAELLYLLGEQDRIVGVSAFAVRPVGIKKRHPVVSVFTHAQQDKIKGLKPDLIIGYSDIQKDIARDLIEKGHNVWVTNHRSLQEVMNYCFSLSSLVGAQESFLKIFKKWQDKIFIAQEFAKKLKQTKGQLSVYIEEWDEPRISGIEYFSELVELCGLVDINRHLRTGFLAKERFPDEEYIIKKSPDLIFGCWCGKKVDIKFIKERKNWQEVSAIENDKVFELPPEIFLQPGAALFEEGIDYLINLLKQEILK